ncbi:MAG TPA: rhomboid family intramembrane serine protease [Candidatus Polarisedimenticolaceae bacterium]|nr:rhomboid family intramembrane serine protease [Candidatus Polarisedimenticolaceae bacterium]
MILIPIGHEEEARRLPWVTFVILGLCGLAFLLTGFGGTRSEWDTLESHERAIEYWLEHPYLRLDPEIERAMHGMATQEMRDTFREAIRTNVDVPAAETVSVEQLELDRLCEHAKNASPDHPFYRFGLVPSCIGPVTLITHMFLHAGWLHLLGNLFILYLCAPFVEDVWGRPLFAGFYAVSGIVAALTFALPHSSLTEPLVGASGAIAGVMGAFAIRYARTRVQFFYAIGLMTRGTFWAPAWFMLGLWFAQQVFLAMLTSNTDGPGDKVAYLAHAGGFVFGAAVAFGMNRYRVEERWLAGAIEARANTVVMRNETVDAALGAAAAGDPTRAWELLTGELRRNPTNVDAAMALWSVSQDAGRQSEAAPAFARMIEHQVRTGNLDGALAHWEELRAAVPTTMLDVRTLVRIAGAYVEGGHRKEAADALRRALLGAGGAPNPTILLRIAETATGIDPALARAAATVALGRSDLDEASRGRARSLAEPSATRT